MSAFQGFPPLLAIFYSEFHPTQGPKVTFEVPEGFYNTIHRPTDTNIHDSYLDFDAISEYIIPKPELCNRLVTISTPLYKVMGYPVSIQDAKYERNALLFNLCFVFEQGRETGSYEQVVRKMARVLRSLEVESEFLYNPSTKSALLNIMEQLLEDLNSYSECQIPINDANMINIKLFPKYRDPPPVYDYQVPVLIVNLEKVMDKYWDLTMQRILPHIDGVHSVKKIAEIGDVDPTLVRIAIQHLLYYGVVKMVDIFQFSNVYAIKPSISYLLRSQRLQSECVNFVSRPGVPRPAFALLYSLYCALKHGLPVRDWVDENHIWALNIDPRRFILYGVIKGFVYRVHKFPVWITHPGDILSDSPNRSLKRFLNGRKHFDELCTLFGCNSKELDETLKADPNIRIIWK
ncbi:nitrogen permease regulator 2 [Phlyctochytrium arcticum]|nr:nitrogen permease regulator 2 [Phlyctochytrium arcticum]